LTTTDMSLQESRSFYRLINNPRLRTHQRHWVTVHSFKL